MTKRYFQIAVIIGSSAVALGALGAHALKKILTVDALASFETAVRYQLLHAVFLIVLTLFSSKYKVLWTLRLLVFGILCFSGSIYLLLLNDAFNWGVNFLWPITPIGGLSLIFGWLSLIWLKPIDKA